MALKIYVLISLFLAHQSAHGELLWPVFVRRRPTCGVHKLFYLNIFSSETVHWILTKLNKNDPWDPLVLTTIVT